MRTPSVSAELLVRSDCLVGESPVLDSQANVLLWIDLGRKDLYELTLGETSVRVTPLSEPLTAITLAADGALAAVTRDGFALLERGVTRENVSAVDGRYRRMNDAKADSRGRLWAGSTGIGLRGERLPADPERPQEEAHASSLGPRVGGLHRWQGTAPTEIQTGFILPNGVGWNLADTAMYLADSYAHTLLVADFDPEDGDVTDFSEVASFSGGTPDGICVDADDNIWVAVWGAGEVQCIRPDGRLMSRVSVPTRQPSSCALGPDGYLYITSARAGMSESELAADPLAGSVFVADVRVVPAPVFTFTSAGRSHS